MPTNIQTASVSRDEEANAATAGPPPTTLFGLLRHRHSRVNETIAGSIIPSIYFVTCCCFVAFLWLAAFLQSASGAYQTEFAGYPDEAAHYITGLLARDYLASGLTLAPLEYAQNYQRHYPKVGLGHWPPVFYGVEGLWTLVFTGRRESVLLLMAVLSAVLGTLLGWRTCLLFGRTAGVLSGLGFIAIPLVQSQTATITPEILLGIWSFLAAFYFGRYLDREKLSDSVLFGLFSALAILTKSNGWALVLLPPFALFFRGKLNLLRRRSFWAGAAVILALCVPWHVFTQHMMRHVWTPQNSIWPHAALRLLRVLRSFSAVTGLFLMLFALIGFGVRVLAPRAKRGITGEWASMAGLLCAVLVFNAILPLGVESRKLLAALPSFILFAVAGIAWIQSHVKTTYPQFRHLPAALAAIVFLAQIFHVPKKQHQGFVEAAATVSRLQPESSAAYFVSGSGAAEGAFISEIAMRDDPRPGRRVVRASKELASSDWNGGNYQLLLNTPEAIRLRLRALSISFVVVEDSPVTARFQHHSLLKNMLQEHPEEWVSVSMSSNGGAAIEGIKLFRRVGQR